eukprot:CAMPEP_0171063302 /NCGR_PEP_ID=MMETSP0766_2-20121228/5567_1 /TAXON_ID=439317 /ORGANISM="Gambierdiscus australes, Strain CAWD 149" /LENGTH=345 /DNA_ID=CAMNT_0011519181 /DNA_START=53 /DNA_END=1090 /DNA_ORIENTATION=-
MAIGACLGWQLLISLAYLMANWLKLLETLHIHPPLSNPQNMEAYCDKIWKGVLPRDKPRLAQFITQAMEEFEEERKMQVACSLALSKLNFLEVGQLKAIMTAALSFCNDAEAVGTLLEVFLELHQSQMLIGPLRTLGALQYCVDTLQRHPGRPELIRLACNFLGEDVHHCELCKNLTVLRSRLVKTSVAAVKRFPATSTRLHESVMMVLSRLSSDPPLEYIHESMIEQGALEGTLTVLRDSREFAALEHAAMVLHNFANFPAGKLKILEADAPRLLFNRLGELSAGAAVGFAKTLQVLLTALPPGTSQQDLVPAEAIAKVQHVMERSPKHTKLQEFGALLLAALT